jgi:hypothetical protein
MFLHFRVFPIHRLRAARRWLTQLQVNARRAGYVRRKVPHSGIPPAREAMAVPPPKSLFHNAFCSRVGRKPVLFQKNKNFVTPVLAKWNPMVY